jgi:uncharacterized membrane protein YsdA (DUF1294 family)
VPVCLDEPLFKLVGSWLIAASVIGFAGMGIDKARAVSHEGRIPEMALLGESLLGGFSGVLLGAFAFHHKTSKSFFMLAAVLGLLVWVPILWELRFVQCLQSLTALA